MGSPAGNAVGTSALSVAGNLVGGTIGGPVGAAIGGMAGGIIGSILLRPQAQATPIAMMQSNYGTSIPYVWGTVRVSGTLIWLSEVSVGSASGFFGRTLGKGGSPSGANNHQSGAVAFCKGPAKVLRIWTDGNLFADMGAGGFREWTKHTFNIVWYDGSEGQQVNPRIQYWVNANVSPPACPAYRGLAYLEVDGLNVANYGGRFPSFSAVVSRTAASHTALVPLMPFLPVALGAALPLLSLSSPSPAVDWVRNMAYTFGSDGMLRSYDLATGACVLAKTLPQALPGVSFSGNSPFSATRPTTVACAPGGALYLIPEYQALFVPYPIWKLDPGTLTLTSQSKIAEPATGLTFGNGGKWNHCAMAVSNGNGDRIVCTTSYTSSSASVSIIDAATGCVAGELLVPGAHPSCFTPAYDMTGACVAVMLCGHTDNGVTQTIDLYVIPMDTIDVWLLLAAAEPTSTYPTPASALSLSASVSWADFGLSGPLTGGYDLGANTIVHDPSDGGFIISNASMGGSVKHIPGTGTIWRSGFTPSDGNAVINPYTFITNGQLGAFDYANMQWVLLNTADGTSVASPITDLGAQASWNPSGASVAFSGLENAVVFTFDLDPVAYPSALWVGHLGRVTTTDAALADIITDICGFAGLTPDMIDVTLVTQTLSGYSISSMKSAGSALQELCLTFHLDMVESDYLLKFVPRGRAPVAAITQAELSAGSGEADKFWVAHHPQEQEMPLQLTLNYPDPDLDYQPGSTYAKRTALPVKTQFSRRKMVVSSPVAMTSLYARNVAENWLYTLWAERDTYDTTIPLKYLFLDPADNVTVAMDNGDSFTLRVERTDIGADYAIAVSLASEDMTTYAPSPQPGALTGASPQQLGATPAARLLLFPNLPLLQDSDDLGGAASRIYYAAGAYAPGFTSGVVSKSADGVSWPAVNTIGADCVWGQALTTLGDTAAPFCTDYANTVSVSLTQGADALGSVSYADMMNGANAALLGQEIIQFQTVTENADGSRTLSALVRGQRGTEWATGLHAAGEPFVLLQAGHVVPDKLALAEINVSEKWKLVVAGQAEATQVVTAAYSGADLKPYAPAGLRRTASGGDVVFSWNRRTRIGGLLADGDEFVPLAEATEAYQAYLIASPAARATLDPSNPATYVRAFPGLASASATYTAAMMAADNFAPATATAYLVVFQLSAIVGRGFPGYAALPAF